jgi:uncharacterized membrane protein YqaE (UPF0057 family)
MLIAGRGCRTVNRAPGRAAAGNQAAGLALSERWPAPDVAPLAPTGVAQAMDLIRIIFAILLPPLGVCLQVGLGGQFWLNILLTLLGYIPGIVHAVWIIARR